MFYKRTYYRFAILFPLLAMLIPVKMAWGSERVFGTDNLGIFLAIPYTGYLLTALGYLRWMRGKQDFECESRLLYVPLYAFGVTFALGVGLSYFIADEILAWFIFLAFFIQIYLGYIYVMLARAGVSLLTGIGFVKPSPLPGQPNAVAASVVAVPPVAASPFHRKMQPLFWWTLLIVSAEAAVAAALISTG